MAHDAPPASATPQLLVWAKSPEGTILTSEGRRVGLVLSTRGIGALVSPSAVAAKVMLVGVSVVGTIAVPLSLIVCGLFGALSVITIVPERAPVAKGVNVTEIAHDAPPSSAAPQLLAWAKSPEGTIL